MAHLSSQFLESQEFQNADLLNDFSGWLRLQTKICAPRVEFQSLRELQDEHALLGTEQYRHKATENIGKALSRLFGSHIEAWRSFLMSGEDRHALANAPIERVVELRLQTEVNVSERSSAAGIYHPGRKPYFSFSKPDILRHTLKEATRNVFMTSEERVAELYAPLSRLIPLRMQHDEHIDKRSRDPIERAARAEALAKLARFEAGSFVPNSDWVEKALRAQWAGRSDFTDPVDPRQIPQHDDFQALNTSLQEKHMSINECRTLVLMYAENLAGSIQDCDRIDRARRPAF